MNNKIEIYQRKLKEQLTKSNLLDFFYNNPSPLRLATSDYTSIFNLLMEGKTFEIENLELTNKTLYQALLEKEQINSQENKIGFYTAEDYQVQNKKLSLLIKDDKLYLTFGLIDYFIDKNMKIISAPLVLMPIKLEYINETDHYQISNINHELYLNECLISYFQNTLNLDISYPLENNFSLYEYLTYVATRVKSLHFSVNNGCFFASLDVDKYYYLNDLIKHQDELSSLDIIKQISYFNSEFYNFKKVKGARLNNSFLSLLNLENDEYKILKRLSLRENLAIKPSSKETRDHLLNNILLHYLLNNQNILLTYQDDNDREEILSILNESSLNRYVIDLSSSSDKKKLLSSLTLLDNFKERFSPSQIDSSVDNFYQVKNNYSRLINTLRMANPPLNLSINQLLFYYYNLDGIPLINITIPNIVNISNEQIDEYLKAIKSFVETADKLKCHYLDHPFYGFKRLDLTQEGYIELKDKIISLEGEFQPFKKAYSNLKKVYHIPFPNDMKDMKAILNILSTVEMIKKLPLSIIKENIKESLSLELEKINKSIDEYNGTKTKLISLYGENVLSIDQKALNEDLKTLSKGKLIKKYRGFFDRTIKIDEGILLDVASSLNDYHKEEENIKNFENENKDLSYYIKDNHYDIDQFIDDYETVDKFFQNVRYLNFKGFNYDASYLDYFNEETMTVFVDSRKQCQIAFNHILEALNYLKEFFFEDKLNFFNLNLISIETRIINMSKNFSSINDYLDFYLSSNKLNKLIPNLADELLKLPQKESYPGAFLKALYYQKLHQENDSNVLSSTFSLDGFNHQIATYEEFDKERREIIQDIIQSQLVSRQKQIGLSLKNIEFPYIKSALEDKIKILPYKEIIKSIPLIISYNKPLFLVNIKDVSKMFSSYEASFDLVLSLVDKNQSTLEGILALFRGSQTIIIDKDPSRDYFDSLLPYQGECFLSNIYKVYDNVFYSSKAYLEEVLSPNNFDKTFIKALANHLTEDGFNLITNYQASKGSIDILVKVPSSKRPTAIIVDHLSYNSLESAINSLGKGKDYIENSLEFAYYHIIPFFYFLDEENQYQKLKEFIIKNTVQERKIKTKKVKKPLIDIIFSDYLTPSQALIEIKDKDNKTKLEIFKEVLEKVSPVKTEEINLLFKDDYPSLVSSLEQDNIISIEHNFIFLENKEIHFKKAPKGTLRELDNVSNEEISSGIKQITIFKPLSQDEMIKLILVSLGYKKMNHSQYFRIQNIISTMIDAQKIIYKDGKLFNN